MAKAIFHAITVYLYSFVVMQIYIAEKPSLAKAIANAFNTDKNYQKGYILLSNGDVITWCIGHLLTQAKPETYDPKYRTWQLNDLPIVPNQWQLEVKAQTKAQFTVVKKWLNKATSIVHAGDPDREGQLLVDEVIAFSLKKKLPIKRLLINDLNPSAVRHALNNLKNNDDFLTLSQSALARARADWLYGINMTRWTTLKKKSLSKEKVLSVGRVQTPLLGLVVKRDQTITDFKPTPYFEVIAQLKKNETIIIAKWQPSEACKPYMDDEKRVLSQKLATHVQNKIVNQPATVQKYLEQLQKQSAPLPFNLSSLQIAANKTYGVSAKQVLDICQTLYEKKQLITYPRSDCRYLPTGHFKSAEKVFNAINKTIPELNKLIAKADLSFKSKAFNDKKVSAHHAIIPTEKAISNHLTELEKKVYQLIARQFLMQFYPPCIQLEQTLSFDIAGGVFVAKAKTTQSLGFRYCYEKNPKEPAALPKLKQGDKLICEKSATLDKQTTPPVHYNDATLLAAMTNIARLVSDPKIKKILKETDGLGTEATRANIIELLIKRQFLQRKQKQIVATELGKNLISELPDIVTSPDITAQWESDLNKIVLREINHTDFLKTMQASLHRLLLTE